MTRTARIVVMVALALLLGWGGLALWNRSGGEVPPVTIETRNPIPAPAPGRTDAGAPRPGAEVGAARQEVPGATGTDPAPDGWTRDPAFQAALGSLRGRLVSPEGLALAGLDVEVEVISESAGPWTRRVARSSGDGRFTANSLLPRKDLRISVTGSEWGGRFSDPWMILTPGGTLECGDLVLSRVALVTGVAADPGGSPLPGARVELVEGDGRGLEGALFTWEHRATWGGGPEQKVRFGAGLRSPSRRVRVTTADAAGRFRFAGTLPGPIHVVIQVPGARLPTRTPVVAAPGRTDLGVLRARSGPTLRARVVDHDGQPVPGAELLVAVAAPDFGWEGLRVLGSDQHRFALAGLPASKFVLGARRPRGAWVLLRKPAPTGADEEHEVRLPAPRDLAVKLVAGPGASVEGVSWAVVPLEGGVGPTGGGRPLDLRPSAMDAGVYRFSGLDALTYRIEATTRDARGVGYGTPGAEAPVEIFLGRVRPVRFVVRDPDGAPVVHAEILVEGRRLGFTGEDGTLTVPLRKKDYLWSTVVLHPGFERLFVERDAPEDLVELQLVPLRRVSGTVILEPGPGPAAGWVVCYEREGSGLQRSTTCDQAGRFSLDLKGVEAGTVVFTALFRPDMDVVRTFRVVGYPDRSFALGPGRELPRELELIADWKAPVDAGQMRGSVWIDGQPAVGFEVRGANHAQRTRVDAAGSFVLGPLRGHRLPLRITRAKPDPILTLWEGVVPTTSAASQPWKLEFATGGIDGRVVDATGRPVADARVVTRAPHDCGLGAGVAWTAVGTDAQGAFSLPQVVAGTHVCEAFQGGDGGMVQDVRVTPGAVVRGVVIQLGATHEVRGSFDLRGLGVRYHPPTLVAKGSEFDVLLRGDLREVWGSVDASSFEVGGLLPGTYQLVLRLSRGDGVVELVHPDPIVVDGRPRGPVSRKFGANVAATLRAEAKTRGVTVAALLESLGLPPR